MNNQMSNRIFCKNREHQGEQIVGYCFNELCIETFDYCSQCIRIKHQAHLQDCKSMEQVAQLVNDAYGMVSEWQKKASDDLEKVKKIYYDIEKYLYIQQTRIIELEKFLQNNQIQELCNNFLLLKSYHRLLAIKQELSSLQLFGGQLEDLHKFYQSLNEIAFKKSQQGLDEIRNSYDLKRQENMMREKDNQTQAYYQNEIYTNNGGELFNQDQMNQNTSYNIVSRSIVKNKNSLNTVNRIEDKQTQSNILQDSDQEGQSCYISYITGEIQVFDEKDQFGEASKFNKQDSDNFEGNLHQKIKLKQETKSSYQNGLTLGNKEGNEKADSHEDQSSSIVATNMCSVLNEAQNHRSPQHQRQNVSTKINSQQQQKMS